MAQIEVTTNNRTLTFVKKELYQTSQIIRGYFWKVEGNQVYPYLLVDSGEGSSYSIRLEGTLYLEFGEKFCQYCGKQILREASEAVCSVCYDQSFYKCRRCIFDGPGKPFGQVCTKDNFPCNSIENKIRCYGKYYSYIGRFGSLIKVGTSYTKRAGGAYYRLIEQGLNEAIVINGFSSLEEVLNAEQIISKNFEFKTALTFMDKIEQLQQAQIENESEKIFFDWHNIANKVLEIFPESKISYVDINDFWSKRKSPFPIKTLWNPFKLSGEVILAQGNVLLMQESPLENHFAAINLSKLVGFEIFTSEELLYSSFSKELLKEEMEL